MRFYRNISKKSTKKILLARLISIVNILSLREIANLASRLSFELIEISALRKYSKSIDFTKLSANYRSFLVTKDFKKALKYRCDISPIKDYKENRKYIFISYLHNNRHKQNEKITYFFRFKFIYLKFFNILYLELDENEGINSNIQ